MKPQQIQLKPRFFKIEIPGDWKCMELKNLVDLLKDGTHNPPPRVDDGIPLLSSENIHDGIVDFEKNVSYIQQSDFEEIHKKYSIQKNDIFLTIVGSIGRTSIVNFDKKFSIQRSVALLRTNEKINYDYLYYFLQSDYFQQQLIVRSKSTAQSGVYLGELEQIFIYFPESKTEQTKITEILFDIDKTVQFTQQTIDKLKSIKNELLTKILIHNLKITKFDYTESQNIPKGINLLKLNQVIKVNPKYELQKNEFYPFVEMAAINEETKEIDYFEKRKFSSGYSMFKNEDILFAKITPSTEHGKLTLLKNFDGFGLGSTELIVLQPSENILSDFLYYYCQTDAVRNYVVSQMAGSTGRQRVPERVFSDDLYIPLPTSKNVQQNLVDNFHYIENLIKLTRKEKVLYEDLRHSLLEELLKGKIRVRV